MGMGENVLILRFCFPVIVSALSCTKGSDDESDDPWGSDTSVADTDVDADADTDADADADIDVDSDVDVDVDDTGGPVDCFSLDPVVEIGTGETEYEPLSEESSVVMVHGPQGGWHMLGSVRVHNMDPIIEVHFTVHDEESGTVVSDNLYRVAVVQDGECTGYYPGMYGYIDVTLMATETATRPPELLSYKPVIMTMEVKDFAGREKTTTLRVMAEPDPMDIEGFGGDTGAR